MKKAAYISSIILFYGYAVLYLFIMIFSILSYFEYQFGIQIPFVEVLDGHSKLKVPLVGLRINVPFSYSIIMMWSAMLYYALYFYAFKEFLKVFVSEKMFESQSLERLRFFLKLNLIPLLYITLFTMLVLIKGAAFRLADDYVIVFAHLVVAFLIYLYLEILKKGRLIQEENDLTI